MWQRSQTVYLILLVVVLCLTLVFPFANYSAGEEYVRFNIFGLSENKGNVDTWFPYYISVALSVGIGLFSITQFKNRKRQLNLGKINYIVIILTIIMLFIDLTGIASKLNMTADAIQYDLVGFMLPVAAIAFQFLANRGIKKDEALVKSMDRLR